MLLPAYGHAPGHQSLKLNLDPGDVVLAADACYFCRSLETLARLRSAGARVFSGHDGAFWSTVSQGPTAIT